MFYTELFHYLQRNEKKENAGSLPRIKACPESSWTGEREPEDGRGRRAGSPSAVRPEEAY